MEGKVCVVTGATAGIGRVTAEVLAGKGAAVVLVGRNEPKGAAALDAIRRATGNGRLRFERADLSSQAEIRALAGRLGAQFDAIDVLVNNAGALFTRRRESADGIEMTFALNHLGYFLLTGLLLDRLRASAAARIVNVASGAHRGARIELDDPQGTQRYGGWRAYKWSKLANVLFTYRLAALLAGTPITANCLHPGFVASRFGHENGGLFAAVLKVAQRLFAIDEAAGARTGIHLATAPEVAAVTGRYFDRCREAESAPASRDEAAARRLWALSESLTGYRYPTA